MPVEFEVPSLDVVEEIFKPAYVEKEGKFTLDADRYHEIRAEPLLKKNRELLDEKKKLAEEKKTLDEKSRSASTDIDRQLKERDQRITELERENREHAIWSPVRALAAKHGVLGDRLEAVMTLLRAEQRFDLEERKLVYKDKNGYATGISPERAFEVYLREELPWAFEASKAAGSGAQNGNKSPGTRTISAETFSEMSHEDRWKAVREGARIA